MNVRRLAAIDMYGVAGTMRRRRIIVSEFVIGFIAMITIGTSMLVVANGGWQIFGAWFIGAGLNYLPLSVHAIDLIRPGVLDEELADVDIRAELRRYTVLQLWVFVPLALVVLAVAQLRRRAPTQPPSQ
jgi:hypothetical protein